MSRFKNVSPLGDLDIPALGLTIPAGEILETADPDVAASLADQNGTWEQQLSPAERKAADKAAAEQAAPTETTPPAAEPAPSA